MFSSYRTITDPQESRAYVARSRTSGFVPHPDEEKNCLFAALLIGIIVVLVVVFGLIWLNSFLRAIK